MASGQDYNRTVMEGALAIKIDQEFGKWLVKALSKQVNEATNQHEPDVTHVETS